MFFNSAPQLKLGGFVLLILLVLAYATVRISQTSLMPGGSYAVYLELDSATGIANKTPVQIAGIQVGHVRKIELLNNNRARLKLSISKGVQLSQNVEAHVKTLGFLGDTYIELYQGGTVDKALPEGGTISKSMVFGDLNSVTSQVSDIAQDIKAITGTLRGLMAGEDSSFARSLKNIEKITASLSNVTTQNEGNLNAIVQNLKAISENLNAVIARNESNVDATLSNVAAISDKVRRGEGTVGRLLNDEETVDKLNDSIDNLNQLLGGANRFKVDLGYHTEYLGPSQEFKQYVSLNLQPRPDKYFLIELVNDPSPDSTHVIKEITETVGGVTTVTTEETETSQPDKFLYSVQFGKKFYGFTFRGGIIESKGGAGIDYNYGPVGVGFSAFDFESKRGEKPHLKAFSTLNLTDNIYLLGGLDDFASNKQDPDWFLGAGLQFKDDDIKSLIGLFSARP